MEWGRVVGLVVAVIKPHSVGHQTFDSYGSATAIKDFNPCLYIVLLYRLWVCCGLLMP